MASIAGHGPGGMPPGPCASRQTGDFYFGAIGEFSSGTDKDLDVRNLTRSARGTAAAPGVRVAQKRGLNRAIADQGWAAFVTILRDRAASAGLPVIAVPAHGTSQSCSRCGADVPKTLSVRRHRCPHCGLDLDRDHNAAICILRRAWPAHGRSLADVPPPVATAGPDASCASGAGGTSVPSSGALAPLVA